MHRNPYVRKHNLSVAVYEEAYARFLEVFLQSRDFALAADSIYISFDLHGDGWKQAFGWDLGQRRIRREPIKERENFDALEVEIADHAAAIYKKGGRTFFHAICIALHDHGLYPRGPALTHWRKRIVAVSSVRKAQRTA